MFAPDAAPQEDQPARTEPDAPQVTSRRGLLEVASDYDGHRWLLSLRGEADLSTIGLLEQELGLAEASAAEMIVVDLSALEFIDSSGLQALLRAERRSRLDGSRLRLIPGPRRVQAVFQMTNTEAELPFLEAPSDEGGTGA